MSADPDDDPYECHARLFLEKLRRQSQDFTTDAAGVDGPLRGLEKTWPQVLAAFGWAAAARATSPAAQEICAALLACADGDIVALQARRRAADVQKLAEAASAAARRQDNPNDAAFLFRYAGIALTQARILEMTEKTGADVQTVMGALWEVIKNDQERESN